MRLCPRSKHRARFERLPVAIEFRSLAQHWAFYAIPSAVAAFAMDSNSGALTQISGSRAAGLPCLIRSAPF